MTAQTPECLLSEHPRLVSSQQGYECTILGVPGSWSLYAVIRGTPTEANHGWGDFTEDGKRAKVYAVDPGDPEPMTTANWKGYTERYKLEPDGQLVFLGFEFDRAPPRPLREVVVGDCYLVFKQDFHDPRLYVPIRDGKLVTAFAEWLVELRSYSPLRSEYRKGFRRSLIQDS